MVSVEVTGQFECKRKPGTAVFVELRERDVFKDDILSWTTVDAQHPFKLRGEEYEIFDVEPYLLVKHDCSDVNQELTINLGKVRGDTKFELGKISLADQTDKGVEDDSAQKTQNFT
ncbi:Transthyretin-like family protein [Teladorsagia circumcincta]|uniref:Transthyretin-like family protein n=1 Tax=Teladorsagia circumcincta TaxID=45464 RepID=A0A2G9U9W8_TELCI|nr:Transthyretin-like family protein [Teladorsagia circumcincta]